jgi:hypothetical protein
MHSTARLFRVVVREIGRHYGKPAEHATAFSSGLAITAAWPLGGVNRLPMRLIVRTRICAAVAMPTPGKAS